MAILARLLRLWYRFRGGFPDRRGNPQPIHRQQLIAQSIPLQKKLLALAEAHRDEAHRKVYNWAAALFVHFQRLCTFPEEDGVEPANNVAGRILRRAVQWRKISFGSRSEEIATARLLSIAQTCKRQQRRLLGCLTEAARCHRRQAAAPSLLPFQH